MSILSVDLASRSWSDLGVVLLRRMPPLAEFRFGPLELPLQAHDPSLPAPGTIACEILRWKQAGVEFNPASDTEAAAPDEAVNPERLAGWLNHLCGVHDVRMMVLDGPQAWKSEQNGLAHARVSERKLNTSAKTGLPGMVKPVTYRVFSEFCIDVYDALCRRGWKRLDTKEQPGLYSERVLIEGYPHAAWKSLGLKALPAKRRSRVSDLAEAMGALRSVVPLSVSQPPNHDQLQAIVAGLAGLAIAERNTHGVRIVGQPPRREQGHWREGFIALPVLPQKNLADGWMKPTSQKEI